MESIVGQKIVDVRECLGNESGLTLVEIIISAAIAIGLALSLAMMLRNSSQAESRLKLRQETNNVRQELRYEKATAGPPVPL